MVLLHGEQRTAAVHAALVGIGGPVAGQVHPLRVENVIGRSSSTDIMVPSANLSRRHTRVLFVAGEFVLEDLGSTNGSRVNGSLVHSAKLADGDRIELGDALFRFELGKP
jgi:pSer/pThr/pTyr-binding forkhead associated (FHA) protein